MTESQPGTLPRSDVVSRTLARNRLGVAAVVFFVMSAAAPLTVVAGVVPLAFAGTGVTALALVFLVVGAVLAVFSVGYVAMAQHVPHAGAFYAYIAQGIGRPFGVGAAWVALVAYNVLQIGLPGAVGAAASPLISQWLGLDLPWWLIALLAWALVTSLGLLRVDVNGTVLALLLLAELAVMLVFSAANLLHPAGGHLTFNTLALGNLLVPKLGAVLVLGVLAFIGFESGTTLAEESKDHRRTVKIATYIAVALIAVLYTGFVWAMTVGVGSDRIVAAARDAGPELVFNLAAAQLGGAAADIGHLLFLTSLIAAMISFHNLIARYMFALGREQVLPRWLGTTSTSGAPRVGSLAQSLLALTVIVTYAVAGLDPLTHLFFWAGSVGGYGVLVLIACTSIAVIMYFAGHAERDTVWRRIVAPGLATVALLVIGYLATTNFEVLLGVAADSPLRWLVPVVYLAVGAVGVGWGLVLKRIRPEVYANIGRGAKAVTAALGLTVPDPQPAVAGSPGHRAAGPESVAVERATPGDAHRAADLIATAFHPLPPAEWLVSDPRERQRALYANFRTFVEHALDHGEVLIAADRSAVAVWFPIDAPLPEIPEYPYRRWLASGPYTDRFTALDTAFDRHHPTAAHLHLAFLAVHPDRQGRGVGTALLQHFHDRLAQAGLPAYLEAPSQRNRAWYARHGYTDHGAPIDLPDNGPRLWPMWRAPQPTITTTSDAVSVHADNRSRGRGTVRLPVVAGSRPDRRQRGT